MNPFTEVNKRNARAFESVFKERGIRAKGAARPIVASRYISYRFVLNQASDLDKVLKLEEPLALASGAKAVRLARDYNHLIADFELPPSLWKSYNRTQLRSRRAIGVAPGGREIPFAWGETHLLFGGSTGSGKTVAIHSAIAALVHSFAPSELKLLIGTPHVQKDDWSSFATLPHLGAALAASEDELAALVDLAYRIYKDREANGSDGVKIALILDEIQHESLLGSDAEKTLNRDIIRKIAQMARGARGFDMRLLLGSQKPSQADMPGIIDNMRSRYVGAVSDASVATQVTGLPGTSAAGLTGSGDFLQIANGRATRFQVAYPDDLDQLPRGEMRALSHPRFTVATGETAVRKEIEFTGDWHMIGRMLAFILIRRQLPGRDLGLSEFGMNWRHIAALKEGFAAQFIRFRDRGTAVDRRVARWFESFLDLNHVDIPPATNEPHTAETAVSARGH